MSQNALARFLMSEKDTRPYWETDHRGMVLPLVKSGYNDSVSYGVPGILGGSAWGTLNDIIEGRQVAKGEIEQGASDAAGAAMTGSLAMTRPSGSIGSGGRIATGDVQSTNFSRAAAKGFEIPEHAAFTIDGQVFTGLDHSRAIRAAEHALQRRVEQGGDAEGFVTTSGRFVTRAEAALLATKAGLREPIGIPGWPEELHSSAVREWKNPYGRQIIAANAPTSAAAPSLQHIAKTAAQEAPGIRAYHGSPHDFDKFDLSKIGTGEGAQAYGPGLYFAENEGVAKSYRDALAQSKNNTNYRIDGQQVAATDLASYEAAKLAHNAGGVDAALQTLMQNKASYPKVYFDKISSALSDLKSRGAVVDKPETPGRMYEVNIKADPADFLDWDKPLSQQSEKVKDAYLSALGAMGHPDPNKLAGSSFASSGSGLENLLNAWSKYDRGKASAALREAGIPGIKYLDQGSRTAGGSSRNYAVWDDSIIEIIRKYGLAGLSMLGGAAAMGNDAKADQPAPLRASDDAAYDDFMKMLGLVNNMGQGYQPGPVQSDYVQDRRNEDPEGVYQSDRVAYRRRMPSADGIPPELRFLLPRQ